MSYKFSQIANRNEEAGFTLVEIAVVMIISGLILTALINSYLRWNDILKSSKTKEHIAVVSDALSAYASRNFRIPCPADPSDAGVEPFGTEIGSGVNGAAIGACGGAIAQAEGIIPFASLGLDASFARDGWGNYMTYQVSPAFTRDPEDLAGVINVHAKCRTTDWIEGVFFVGGQLNGGRNVEARKARFCCMQPLGSEANILSTSAADASPNQPALIFRGDGLGFYNNNVDAVADPNVAAEPINGGVPPRKYYNNTLHGGTLIMSGHTDLPAYVLISHGSNGAGAFIGNNTLNRNANDGGVSETINATANNQTVYDLEHDSSNDNTYYDDIVSWQTQSNLMARLRRDSCAVP